MPRISSGAGPSSADVAKELTLLTKQGKINVAQNKPHEWVAWTASLCR